jgi:hypothetical protein
LIELQRDNLNHKELFLCERYTDESGNIHERIWSKIKFTTSTKEPFDEFRHFYELSISKLGIINKRKLTGPLKIISNTLVEELSPTLSPSGKLTARKILGQIRNPLSLLTGLSIKEVYKTEIGSQTSEHHKVTVSRYLCGVLRVHEDLEDGRVLIDEWKDIDGYLRRRIISGKIIIEPNIEECVNIYERFIDESGGKIERKVEGSLRGLVGEMDGAGKGKKSRVYEEKMIDGMLTVVGVIRGELVFKRNTNDDYVKIDKCVEVEERTGEGEEKIEYYDENGERRPSGGSRDAPKRVELPEVIEEQHGDSSNEESIADIPVDVPVNNPMALSDPLVNIQDLEINPQDMQQPEIISPERITKEVTSKEPSPYFARQKTEKPKSPPRDKPANLPDLEQDQPSTTEEFILPRIFEEPPKVSILEPVPRAQIEPDASSDGGNDWDEIPSKVVCWRDPKDPAAPDHYKNRPDYDFHNKHKLHVHKEGNELRVSTECEVEGWQVEESSPYSQKRAQWDAVREQRSGAEDDRSRRSEQSSRFSLTPQRGQRGLGGETDARTNRESSVRMKTPDRASTQMGRYLSPLRESVDFEGYDNSFVGRKESTYNLSESRRGDPQITSKIDSSVERGSNKSPYEKNFIQKNIKSLQSNTDRIPLAKTPPKGLPPQNSHNETLGTPENVETIHAGIMSPIRCQPQSSVQSSTKKSQELSFASQRQDNRLQKVSSVLKVIDRDLDDYRQKSASAKKRTNLVGSPHSNKVWERKSNKKPLHSTSFQVGDSGEQLVVLRNLNDVELTSDKTLISENEFFEKFESYINTRQDLQQNTLSKDKIKSLISDFRQTFHDEDGVGQGISVEEQSRLAGKFGKKINSNRTSPDRFPNVNSARGSKLAKKQDPGYYYCPEYQSPTKRIPRSSQRETIGNYESNLTPKIGVSFHDCDSNYIRRSHHVKSHSQFVHTESDSSDYSNYIIRTKGSPQKAENYLSNVRSSESDIRTESLLKSIPNHYNSTLRSSGNLEIKDSGNELVFYDSGDKYMSSPTGRRAPSPVPSTKFNTNFQKTRMTHTEPDVAGWEEDTYQYIKEGESEFSSPAKSIEGYQPMGVFNYESTGNPSLYNSQHASYIRRNTVDPSVSQPQHASYANGYFSQPGIDTDYLDSVPRENITFENSLNRNIGGMGKNCSEIGIQDGKEEILIVSSAGREEKADLRQGNENFEKIYTLFKEFKDGLGKEVPQEVAFEMFMRHTKQNGSQVLGME